VEGKGYVATFIIDGIYIYDYAGLSFLLSLAFISAAFVLGMDGRTCEEN